MTIKEKLEEFDLFDQSITRHGHLENIRDYEIIGYLCGQDFDVEVSYIFKGCLEVHYKNTVSPSFFSMDERLLHLDRQSEPDYPEAFIWDAGAIIYPGWKLEEQSDELKSLEKAYGLKFYKLNIISNAYSLIIIFHDLETTQLTRQEKVKSKI